MTKLSSKLRPLIAFTSFAAAISCGGSADLSPTADLAVDQQAAGTLYTLTCQAPGTGFGAFALPPGLGGLPFTPLASLATVPNPVLEINPKTGGWALPATLSTYVADLTSAIQLGKALFWDVQAASDNRVSCATCHFQAGGDVRSRSQLNPGANALFPAGKGPGYSLVGADFPFNDPANPTLHPLTVDETAGSQGVSSMTFGSISATGAEVVTKVSDPIFKTARRTTGVNSPSAINAVFNHRNFFNGRSQPEFNGVNNWGTRDAGARAWQVIDAAGNVGQVQVRIQNASLASQAVGPPLNDVEMSAKGRTFPDLGKKLLLLKPLGLQKVDPKDSVLGGIAELRGNGIRTTYAALVQKAFQPQWWNTTKTVTVGGKGPYTLTQANFALFWGISIMLYEATLVANDSPMDRYVASRTFDVVTGNLVTHNPALLAPVVTRLNAQGPRIPVNLPAGATCASSPASCRNVTTADILLGLDLFEKPLPLPGTQGIPAGKGAGCAFCHLGAETTSASVRALTAGIEAGDIALRNAGMDLRMERMFTGKSLATGTRYAGNPQPPQPPPPVPLGTDVITFDSGTYAVTVTSVGFGNTAPNPLPDPVDVRVYDAGWYDVGVRPTSDDVGIGGVDLVGNPLSWTRYYQQLLANPSTIRVPGGGLGCVDANGNPVVPPSAPLNSPFAGEVLNPATGLPLLSGGLTKTDATDVDGSFKTPALRNVELNGPYFHNGGKATLRQAVELYDDGGNFPNANLSPLIRPLGLTPDQVSGLVAFMLALTDDRVLFQRAPFDHPALPLYASDAAGADVLTTTMPAVGAAGLTTPLPRFLNLNPFE